MLMIRRPMPMIGLRMDVDQRHGEHPHGEPEKEQAGRRKLRTVRIGWNHAETLPCAREWVNPGACSRPKQTSVDPARIRLIVSIWCGIQPKQPTSSSPGFQEWVRLR